MKDLASIWLFKTSDEALSSALLYTDTEIITKWINPPEELIAVSSGNFIGTPDQLCDLRLYRHVVSFKASWREMYEGYPESKFRWTNKKKYVTNHIYCHLIYISYTIFQHSFHHCWGTCHNVAPVFVSLHRRMMPPAMQSTPYLLLWPSCCRGTADQQGRI